MGDNVFKFLQGKNKSSNNFSETPLSFKEHNNTATVKANGRNSIIIPSFDISKKLNMPGRIKTT